MKVSIDELDMRLKTVHNDGTTTFENIIEMGVFLNRILTFNR